MKGRLASRRDSLGLHSEDAPRTLCHFLMPAQTLNGTLYLACPVQGFPSSSEQHDCYCETIPANKSTVIEVIIQRLVFTSHDKIIINNIYFPTEHCNVYFYADDTYHLIGHQLYRIPGLLQVIACF